MSDSFTNYLANLGDVTIEEASKREQPNDERMMDGHNDQCSEESNGETSENGRRKKLSPRTDDIEEVRTDGSADDMDLDETIDSHIGVRMESQGQHLHGLPSDDNEEDEDDEDDDLSVEPVNILDSLPLEGAPIEGQEVTEADLFCNDDDEEEDEDEVDKSLSRSGDEESQEGSKCLGEHEDDGDPAKKKQKKDDNTDEQESKLDKKSANMRRNIREVMDETQLDEATLAAQRQEMERLRRVQEQQRIIREVQRRQSNKGVSLLRSNQGVEESSEVRLPSTVMLKVNSNLAAGGQVSVGPQSSVAPRRPMAESSRFPRVGRGSSLQNAQTSISRIPTTKTTQASTLQQRIRMMTPSVSISPVVPKKEPIEHLEYFTDSDLSDVDPDADDITIQEKQMQQARKLSGAPVKPGQKIVKKDVVTISSSSESSDDDCIVLSDPSDGEATDNDEDPANSGMHTNDRYNIPDEQGRVLVNVGHPDDEPDVFLAPQVARIIKPHQIGGIRFLYDNIVESIERYKTSAGFGCILAHSMGLGKTLQVASFCDIFFRCTSAKTVLCIMPINTLQNWLAEFNMWLPYEDPNKPKVEEKPVIKEENSQSNQSDMSYMSRPGSEHDPIGQQHQYPPPPDPNNPYGQHPGYNQNYPPYPGAPGTMYDPRYGPYPGASGYNPIKTEPPYHSQPINPYGVPQYNPGYPANPTPTYPGAQGMNPTYPGYGNNPYPTNYGNPNEQDMKKTENNEQINAKPEIKEEPKKEKEEETKKEDKKEETVNTPFSVDAPAGLELRPRHFNLHILNDSHKTMAARARVIREWQRIGGVLLIGYELYRQLSLKKPNKAKRKRGQPMPFRDPMENEEEDKNKPLLDEMHVSLVNPGPDLVICDEGHRIKNSHASISLALKQMRTKRRIVLTGYPLQNNLLEYWCMVDFVRPNYLGTKSEFCNMFERPIQNGQCIDSTPQDIRLMRYRAHVLHALLEGFVQRRSHSVLQVSLPRKEEYIMLVRMTPHQRKLYDVFMNQVVKTRAVPNPLKAFAVCCKIWNHPDVLYHFLKKRQANEEDDLDLEETMADKAANATPGAKRGTKPGRKPKGESRAGKKANAKNKPALSVHPMNDNPENDGQKQTFPNFNPPPPQNFPQQPTNTYPQQPGYQNYQGGEYNNYYGNQNQQSQEPPTNQNYPPYQQNSNYNSNNQQYQGQQTQSQQQQQQQQQQQTFNDPNTTAPGSYAQRFPGPLSAGPTQPQNPVNAEGFTRPNYPYQGGQTYPQSTNQQTPGYQNQYTSYPPTNQNQGYNNTQNYTGAAQQNQTPNIQNTQAPGGYMNNQQQQPPQGQTPNAPNYSQNQQIPNMNYQSSITQPNQNVPAIQNQPHAYSGTPNPISTSPGMAYNSNQQSQGYQANVPQNQMKGYQNVPQNQGSNYEQPYSSSNTNQQNQPIYPNDPQQQQQQQQQQQPQQQQQQPQQQQYQQTQYNQPIPPFSSISQKSQVSDQLAYQTNQTGTVPTNQTSHSYQATPQQNQPQNPPQNYQQARDTKSVNQNEQPYGYPQSDPQTGQNNPSTYPPIATNTQIPTGNNQQPQNQYWQGNYQNSNDSYYNSNTSQYQSNYQNNIPPSGNFQANQPNSHNQYSNYPSNTISDMKPPQTGQNSLQASNVNVVQGSQQTSTGVPPFNPVANIEPPKDVENKNETIIDKDKDKEDKSDDEVILKDEVEKDKLSPGGLTSTINSFRDQEPGIPYDWAIELMKDYVPGLIDASAKMTIFFCILEEAIRLGDRVLTFSQSLFTLNLIEDFLARNDFKYSDGKTEAWAKNVNYYRLDGSTTALEREKLINEFNTNPKVHLFLVSTRAGSLGINLVGANRAIVFDASWNPCHDTQAVCRVYRYGQRKNCYVYRLVTDNCLERKIYDRQISKQGMSDRVVDQCNPDAHLSLKEATTLSWDWEEDSDVQDFSDAKDKYNDEVMKTVLDKYSSLLTKAPFHHESLLVDRKDKKLSQAEKRLARRGYELEKMAANCSKPSYNYVPGNTAPRVTVSSSSLQMRQIRDGPTPKPVASVRPMQQRGAEGLNARNPGGSRWIPAEVWQRQGMSAQEMTLPLDVVIPTNSPDKGSIVLKAGQKVMVLKSPKGIYMQLESGKIIAIRTALKLNQQKKDDEPTKKGNSLPPQDLIFKSLESENKNGNEFPMSADMNSFIGATPSPQRNSTGKSEVGFPLRNNSAISIIPKTPPVRAQPINLRPGASYRPFGEKEVVNRRKNSATAITKPYSTHYSTNQASLSRIKHKQDALNEINSMGGDSSNSSDGHRMRSDQRVEEVRIEDVVSDSRSNSEYSPSSRPSSSDASMNLSRPMMDTKKSSNFPLETPLARLQDRDMYMNDPKKLHRSHQMKDKKLDGNDEIIVDDPMRHHVNLPRPQPRPRINLEKNPMPNFSHSPSTSVSSSPTPVSATPSKSKTSSGPGSPREPNEPGYPYAQYPRYYDYPDPRSRPLTDPYTSYYPTPPTKSTPELTSPAKPTEVEISKPVNEPTPIPSYTKKSNERIEPQVVKPVDTAPAASSSTTPVREDPHGPTAFSHPSSVRPGPYPGPYPSTPYDPYTQHYPPAPVSSAAYSAGAPGYPAPYTTPSYNADYSRMYSAFPPPPPATTDPYRSYAPPPPPPAPTSHPSNYYPPFPHPPPPPYPNYSFLPPYPNPSTAEPQPPPAQQ